MPRSMTRSGQAATPDARGSTDGGAVAGPRLGGAACKLHDEVRADAGDFKHLGDDV